MKCYFSIDEAEHQKEKKTFNSFLLSVTKQCYYSTDCESYDMFVLAFLIHGTILSQLQTTSSIVTIKLFTK